MCLDNRVDAPVTIPIVTIRPNCFRIYEVIHFDANVRGSLGFSPLDSFIRTGNSSPLPPPRTWETDVSCDWSKICYRNHLPFISRSSKRYQSSLGLKLALSLPQVSGVVTASGEALMVEMVNCL